MNKLQVLVRSRRFWAVLTELVAIGTAVAMNDPQVTQAVAGLIFALTGYTISIGLNGDPNS